MRFQSLKVIIFGILLSVGPLAWGGRKNSKPVDWVAMARSLTGESEVIREKALKRLRSIEKLDEVLTEQIKKPSFENEKLNTQKFLALDVVSALNRKSLIPILIAESQSDTTGYAYHTMNTLFTAKNFDQMVRLYHERLLLYPSSPAVKLALLDTLGRVGFELSLAEIRYVNKNATDEVKSAILSYMREIMILKNRRLYQEFFPEIMLASSFEVRMQALYLFEELLVKKKLNLKDAGLQCDQDQNKTVRSFCKKLLESYS